MIVESIRLHPFGATIDRTLTLGAGVLVVLGPNEAGKSTVTNALLHTFFTPCDLTPAKLKREIGRWYPRPVGDHVRATVTFRADGRRWSLMKTWGAGSTVELRNDEGMVLRDSSKVQETLRGLLRRSEGTWRNVLFLGQAQLVDTLKGLRDDAHGVDDVADAQRAAGVVVGDVTPDKLREALNARLDRCYGRWDRVARAPEKGRGIGNPWTKDVGSVLKAFYRKEELRLEHAELLAHEKSVDEVNQQLAEARSQLSLHSEFVTGGQNLSNGLTLREAATAHVERLTAKEEKLAPILQVWPGADRNLKRIRDDRSRSDVALSALLAEDANALRHEQGESLRRTYAVIDAAKRESIAARQKLESLPTVDAEELGELRTVQSTIDTLTIQTAAQALTAELTSSSTLVARVRRGIGEEEVVNLTPDARWAGNAPGRIDVFVGELHLMVKSGQDDVDELFERVREAEERRTLLLGRLGCMDLADAEARAEAHAGGVRDQVLSGAAYLKALQGRSADEWDKEVATLDALPKTRERTTILGELEGTRQRQAALKLEEDTLTTQVEAWTKEFVDVSGLMKVVLETNAALQEQRDLLAKLPTLPEGFATAAAFQGALDERERLHEDARQRLITLGEKRATLLGRNIERSAEDLYEELALAEREFARCLEEAEAYQRILTKLETVVADDTTDPYATFGANVSRYFDLLTSSRYRDVTLDGQVPSAAVSPNGPMAPDMLSRGTLGSFALATRLALGDAFVEPGEGFMIMDDPLTDMDPVRQRAAVAGIHQFGADRQVVVFTCHPEQAAVFTDAGCVVERW